MKSSLCSKLEKHECDGILVVEDEPTIRDGLKMLLELEGYKVHTACNGNEGLCILRSSVHPCVILLDLMMPVMNGVEFLEVKKQDNSISSIPVCIVSGALDQPEETKTCAFMKKPVDIDCLMKLIGEYCNDKLLPMEAIA